MKVGVIGSGPVLPKNRADWIARLSERGARYRARHLMHSSTCSASSDPR
jgi:hypothetical protein